MTRQVVLQTFLLLACQVSVFSAEPAFRSWAIVTSPEIRETGIADLLAVQLSKMQLELVERDEIDRLTRELELSRLLGAVGAADRLQLGQRVGANAMILLSRVTQNDTPVVRLVICDCVYGSRLLLEHFPQPDTDAALIADAVARAVVQTRERFSNGVESVITVSSILSKNLTRDFDHLQYGFAALLGQALNHRAGIAVLEIEETRAISDELRQSNGEIRKRKMPLFIEGEFRVLQSESASKFATRLRSCEITLRDRSGKASQPDVVYRGNSGLTHLKDLYALEELVLVKADVSDAGLRTIGDLRGLKAVCGSP